MRRQGNLLGSEIMGAATDLREALRPVVAFRATLEKATTEDQLRLAVLEANLPESITHVLDLHQNLLLALAIGAKVESEKSGVHTIEQKVDETLAREKSEPAVIEGRRATFLDD